MRQTAGLGLAWLLFGGVFCARPLEPRFANSAGGDPKSLQVGDAAPSANAERTESRDAGSQPAAQDPRVSDHQRRASGTYIFLEVIGPPAQFRGRATRPTDPEIVYLEESGEYLNDGRRRETAVASSPAAVQRFKAIARARGFEVRP